MERRMLEFTAFYFVLFLSISIWTLVSKGYQPVADKVLWLWVLGSLWRSQVGPSILYKAYHWIYGEYKDSERLRTGPLNLCNICHMVLKVCLIAFWHSFLAKFQWPSWTFAKLTWSTATKNQHFTKSLLLFSLVSVRLNPLSTHLHYQDVIIVLRSLGLGSPPRPLT